MADDLRSTTLGQEVDLLTGFPFKSVKYTKDLAGVRLLRGDNIAQGKLRWEGVKRWPTSETEVVEEYCLRAGDVVIAMDRPWIDAGLKFAAVTEHDLPCLLVQRVARLRPKPSLDKRFLRYVVASSDFTNHVLGVQTGTAVPHISSNQIKEFRFRSPPLPEQRTIGDILGHLDDKIELNRRMNETLEGMARTLFKSWFVDFEPVRTKAKGRKPQDMDSEIAALFPDSFVMSSLGKIPCKWRTGTLENILCELETGSRPKGGVSGITNGVPSIGAESIVGLGKFDFTKTKYVPQDFYDRMTKGRIKSRDVLLYKDGGRPGEYEPHASMFGDGFPFERCCINEHVYRLRANELATQSFLYFWLRSDAVMEELRVKGTGVAIPGLNSTAVRSLAALIPTQDVLARFEFTVEPLIQLVLSNCKESRTLENIHDALLPKLLSGEIRVSDALQQVERGRQ